MEEPIYKERVFPQTFNPYGLVPKKFYIEKGRHVVIGLCATQDDEHPVCYIIEGPCTVNVEIDHDVMVVDKEGFKVK